MPQPTVLALLVVIPIWTQVGVDERITDDAPKAGVATNSIALEERRQSKDNGSGQESAKEENTDVPVQKRWSGAYCGIRTAGQHVIHDAEAWKDLWGQINRVRRPAPAPPKVDFEKHMAVAMFLGQRNTGGYSIRITAVRDTGQEVVVQVKRTSPPPGAMVTMALTQPYDVVTIAKTRKPVKFENVAAAKRHAKAGKSFGPIVSPPVKPSVSPPLRELGGRPRPKRTPDAHTPERKTLNQYLAKLSVGPRARILDIESADLEGTFPKHIFFVLRYRQYPVAFAPTPPLAVNNVFAVSDGDVVHLKSDSDLKGLFRSKLPAIKNAKAAIGAATAWLRLSQELRQDGFIEFEEPKVDILIDHTGETAKGVAQVVQKRGDKGEVTVTMAFAHGKLVRVTPGGKIHPGIRPRCQATLLLDPNPVVRAIARRDLVVMGTKAKEYIHEQRAKAGPKLRREIDDVWRQIIEEGR